MTRSSYFLVLLTMLFVGGCSSGRFSEPEGIAVGSEYADLNKEEVFDGITWVGRVVGCEAEHCEAPNYELVRLAPNGTDEVVLYQALMDGIASDVKWSFSEEDRVFYFTHVISYGEGTKNVDILFREGEELIRADYGEFWGMIQNLTVKVGEADYPIELEMNKDCVSEAEGAGTELHGLRFGTEFVSLPKSQIVSCIVVDGSYVNPVIESISMENGSMTLLLPGEIRAVLQVDEDTRELAVRF